MRNIYIDCGVHEGKNLKRHYGFEIYGFEPNPEIFTKIETLEAYTKLFNKAVWLYDDKMEFHITKRSESCSLYPRSDVGETGIVWVECIDFDKWIKDKFNEDDYIILKMDIEGAEYPVLYNMIHGGSIEYINELFVEWHNNLPEPNKIPKSKTVELERLIKDKCVEFTSGNM